ncbi:hypothetical protein QAD02_011067 [Eretmocerus hayati]|uniref:Uncharacterized protein n=1 Tax=Eretmocerus hayati TaxID=131215 RepID=A0ACC2NXF3_9HYME|nr:hypothetical protein QAD02_011067 [Eretmocerus hayati]
MSTPAESCYVYSENPQLSPIFLPDKQEVFIGRSVETRIEDTQCSRKQIRLYAYYDERKVSVEQVGLRPSGLNGFKTERGVKVVAQHGDRLEILYDKYPYKIEFNPILKTTSIRSPSKPLKRLLSQDSEGLEDEMQDNKRTKLTDGDDNGTLDEQQDDEKKQENLNLPSTSSSSGSNKATGSSQSGAWENNNEKTLYIYKSSDCEGRSKVAAFDMDKTLIKTHSGLEFPKDCNDWELLYPEVPGKLKKLYQDGYKVVIFSNQNALGTGKVPIKDFKVKIERIVKKIGVPMQVFLATGYAIYRKPCPGMWNCLVNEKNDGVKVDKENSFFVGDAAGRPAGPNKKKKDFSMGDRLLAVNVGLKFYTPEEYFLGYKQATYNEPVFDPKKATRNTVLYEPPTARLDSGMQEVIVMVGSPASGKSHFCKTHMLNCVYVNRDTLGSWQKCVAEAEKALDQGRAVVVDNTNPDKESRQRYIKIAQKRNIPARCFVMNLTKEHVKHNNMFRKLTDPSHQVINETIIHSYFKNFQAPTKDEGFTEIVKVNFVPSFKSKEDRQLYEMHLLGA